MKTNFCLAVLALLLTACGGSRVDRDSVEVQTSEKALDWRGFQSASDSSTLPDWYVDETGVKFVKLEPASPANGERIEEFDNVTDDWVDNSTITAAALADNLRAVTTWNGWIYIEETGDVQWAQDILDHWNESDDVPGYIGSDGRYLEEETGELMQCSGGSCVCIENCQSLSLVQGVVVGGESRTRKGSLATLNFPSRAIGNFLDWYFLDSVEERASHCTATMIGRSTMLTAAHCIQGLVGNSIKSRDVDAGYYIGLAAERLHEDSPVGTTFPLGMQTCFRAKVPNGWLKALKNRTTHQKEAKKYDHGLIEFDNVSCFGNPAVTNRPGLATGYWGWRYGAAIIPDPRDVKFRMMGYPGEGNWPNCAPPNRCSPALSYESAKNKVEDDFNEWDLVTWHDGEVGQSGSAISFNVDNKSSEPRAVAVLAWEDDVWPNNRNFARTLSKGVMEWMKKNSNLMKGR